MTVCRLIAVLVLLHCAGGVLGANVRTSIIGGKNAEKGQYPFMVHLNITTKDGLKKWRCGGTILNKNWLLTAAHCFDESLGPSLRRCSAWVGSHELQKKSARYMEIENIVRHPNYRALSTGYQNDIALLKLKKDVKLSAHVKLVKLASADDTFNPSSECWIIGWGQVGNGVPLPDPEILQELKIPIVPQEDCKKTYPQLPSDTLCAGTRTGGKDACEGDFGGPLLCLSGGEYVQAGIMSSASPGGCGLPGRPGIYMQVSKYLSFINDYIHQAEEASADD